MIKLASIEQEYCAQENIGTSRCWHSAAFAQTPAIDWDKQKAEILRHYRALVQIDTSNPPGNETRVVEYLKKVWKTRASRRRLSRWTRTGANLVARLKGNGSKRPLLILAHTDVVGVQREKWPVDPFGAVIKDGYIWGRGTRRRQGQCWRRT